MCLAIPGKLIEVDTAVDPAFRTGVVSFGGITRKVNLSMVPEARQEDYLLVHVGVALSIVDEEEAGKIFETLQKAEWLDELNVSESEISNIKRVNS